MNDLEMDLDLGGSSADELEQGGLLSVAGWFRAALNDITLTEKDQVTFEFKVTHGPWKGATSTSWLSLPSAAPDQEKAEKYRKRLGAWAHRLGLWDGERREHLRVNWADAVGREVVIHVEKQIDKDTRRESHWISYAGVYPPDHEKIPDDVRKALGLPPAKPGQPKAPPQARRQPAAAAQAASANGVPGYSKQNDYSDL